MKKKIAILATYIGVVNRGAETFVIELSKQLMDEYDIDIYSTGRIDALNENIIKVTIEKNSLFKMHEFLYMNLKIYRRICNKIYWIIPDILYQKKFTKKVFLEYISGKKYDLIFPNNGIWGAIYAKKFRKIKKVPYIYTGHGGIGYGERIALEQNPDYYIALNTSHEQWARKYSNNIRKIYNGINCGKFKKIKNFKKDLEEKKQKNILVVGALTKFKRHKLIIDAVSLLSNCSLTILGQGELYNELKEYGYKKLGKNFKIDAIAYEEIKKYYEKADMFTLASTGEPFGIVYLEAMAMGLPVVAPNDQTRKEIIGNSGILCNCENPEEYAQAISKVMSLDWDGIPRKQALKFDWCTISLQYKEIIEKVTAR